MIYLIAGLSLVGLFLALILVKAKGPKTALVSIMSIISFASIIFIMLNNLSHFGMVQKNKIKTSTIYSPSSSKVLPLLVYQKLNDDLSIYLYKDSPNGKTTNTDTRYHVNNRIEKTNEQHATLVSNVKTWEYPNDFSKKLFANQNHGEFIEQENTFKIPNNWEVLTVKQSAALAKKLKTLNSQDKMQNEIKSSHLSEEQQKQMQKSAVEKVIEEVKKDN